MKIAIIDFYNLAHITIHSKNILEDKTLLDFDRVIFGRYARRMFSKVVDILEKFKPDEVIVASDWGSWRKNLKENYKQNRKVVNPKFNKKIFYKFIDLVYNNFEEFMPFKFVKVQNCEGDDIIYVLSKYLTEKDNEVLVFTTDKDLLQVYRNNKDNIKVINLIYGSVMLNSNPDFNLFYKVVRGDRSDGILSLKKGVRTSTIEKWFLNKELFKNFLKENKLAKKFILNKKLIDYEYIPEMLQRQIIKQYLSIKEVSFDVKNYYHYIHFIDKYNIENTEILWNKLERWYKEVKNV